ncbi:MAG: phosphatase PAP2 family protein, partial [Chitinophagaceae bacterium]
QLNPQNTDENAGSWKPILLASPDEFAIDAPIAINTSTYKTGINEIKSYQANFSKENQDLINYWSIGGVLRWNQIMQELVAKHNRPPYQNENGTYPIPLASNPFANPEFPFSNPPYAARAYAYLSTAQYDALIATWYYKKKFNSLPAYANDPNIKVLIPKSNLSSFPSEDGVLAGVSSEILKLLFPTEISFIQQKVEEQIKYKIIAGISIRNDVEASFLLGKKVAAKYIARAATDGAGAAVGNQTVWTSLEKSALDRGETPWKSLENPVRPPMLPMFGNVNSFLISSTEFKATRPIPPPSTNSALFLKELNEVKYYASNATKDQLRTVTFWADGVGTYTPPGHWNAIAIDLFAYKSYSEVRWARNMAMLNMAMFDAAISCWDAKYYYFNPRPCQVNPEIKTLTGVPNFPAYVSGHSTFSGAAASVLSYIIPEQSQNLTEMANEASMSRLYGGIHYRSDCEQGLKLGKDI